MLDVENNTDPKSLNIYPNPLRSQSIIEYSTTMQKEVLICIYNQKGQLVRKLLHHPATSGTHRAVWYGDDDFGGRVSSGLYLVKVMSNEHSKSERLMVLD